MQTRFGFRPVRHGLTLRHGEIVVDLFAGGGGASEALLQALDRDPDVAINHDATAIALHAANHPYAKHLKTDIWHAEPRRVVGDSKVGWLHASPDCTHFSQAKGGQPRSRATRSLSWVVLKWAGQVRPRIISLENVRQILQWGPLVAKRADGRVVRVDRSTAAVGERVPIDQQWLVPDKRRQGKTWRRFVTELERMGYVVEWRLLKACDYGAGTSRERLFMVARCDGEPIRWPAPTHGPGRPKPYVTAADCIDWSIPCPSIFARKRPLADATCRRIARGLKRYVIDAAEPFIVPATHQGGVRCHAGSDPLPTITTAQRGELMAVAPTLALVSAMAQNVVGQSPAAPLPTVLAGATRFGVVSAFLEQANGGPRNQNASGHAADEPTSTITQAGSQQRLVTAHLATLRGDNTGSDAADPLRTVSAGGEHHALVEYTLSPEHEAGALRVAAFLMRYHGSGGQWADCREPMTSVTTKGRLALVTVLLQGVPYVIVDIGLRMLTPAELFKAQGFPASYIIDRTADGRKLTKTEQVRLVGNSVSPPPMAAIAKANITPAAWEIAA